MSNVDSKSIPYHRAETWSTVLAALDNDFRDPELAEFIPYVAFTWKIIKLVVICRDEKTVEDSIQKRVDQIAKNDRLIEEKQAILKHLYMDDDQFEA